MEREKELFMGFGGDHFKGFLRGSDPETIEFSTIEFKHGVLELKRVLTWPVSTQIEFLTRGFGTQSSSNIGS